MNYLEITALERARFLIHKIDFRDPSSYNHLSHESGVCKKYTPPIRSEDKGKDRLMIAICKASGPFIQKR